MNTLHDCLAAIKVWMSLDFLQLNSDKTEVLIIGPDKFVSDVCLGPLASDVKPSTRNLRVIFDQNLDFDPHINMLVQTSFFQLCNTTKISC